MRARVHVLRGTLDSFLLPTTSSPMQANPAGVHSSSPLPSAKNFSHSFPTRLRGFFLQGENFQTPLPKLKEVWAGAASSVIFSSISFLFIGFFLILFLLLHAWYARLQNRCFERSGVRRSVPFLCLSLSPHLSLSCSLSPSLFPVSHCTSPPFHFLSLPLLPSCSHRHTAICTSLLFTITVVPLPTMLTRKICCPKSRKEQIAYG